MFQRKIITAKNLGIGYPKSIRHPSAYLYPDLSFDLYEGELVCLLGANGAGKSTLLRTMSATQVPLSGSVLLQNKDIQLYSKRELSKKIGFVLTDKISAGGLTVRELVEMGRYPYSGFFGQLNKQDKELIDKAIEDVNISHKSNSYIAELSDGERQKALIAKTLAQECPVIFLDEPTAFLDVKSSIELVFLLHQLAIKQNKTILLTTHNVSLALHLSDRLWLLSRDNGLRTGVTEDIVLSGYLDRFFDGDNITFDNKSGVFLPKIRGSKTAYIVTDNDIYSYWAKNLLNRYNILTTNEPNSAHFKIDVLSPTSIVLLSDNYKKEFENFSQLAVWLNNYE